MCRFLIFLFIFTFTKLSLAQKTQKDDLFEKNKLRTKNLAHEAQRTGDLYLAIYYYEELFRRDSSDFSVLKDLADGYRLTNNYKMAETLYVKIAESDKVDSYPESLYYLALMQKSNGKYEAAIQTFGKLKKKNALIQDEGIKKQAKSDLLGCELALQYKDSIAKESLSPSLSINHKHIDFSPIPLSDNKLIFGSLDMSEELIYTLEEFDSLGTPSRKFYVARKEKDKWKVEGELDGPFNLDSVDVANGTFSLDSSVFYFTRCAKNWKFSTVCSIYQCKKEGNAWSEPEMMNNMINLPDFTSTHPTIGINSKTNAEILYFASDREGGKGGMDIWFSEFDPRKKTFKTPKNAGSGINTIGTEVTPFYDIKAKTLYFASNGKPGFGGLDLFKAMGESKKWEPAINLGKPINSQADDLDFILKPSAKGGYLVSNRIGGQSLYHSTCCDDIYEFSFLNFVSINCIVEVVDTLTKECVKDGTIINVYITDENGNFLTQKQLVSECKTELEIRPGFNYLFEAKHPAYFTNSIAFQAKDVRESITLHKLIELTKKPVESMVIPNINFDFNSPNMTDASKHTLDSTIFKLLLRNPSLQVEISAHTDDKGSDDYNLKLSQKRAESVSDYLTSKGIPKQQIKAVGYGETRPIAPNKLENGADNPEGRTKNRRTEFKIIGEVEPQYTEELEVEEKEK